MPSLRPVFVCTVIALALVAFYHIVPGSQHYLSLKSAMSYTSASGYLRRATPYPNPHSYTANRAALKFLVLRNGMVEHDGFTLAIFEDRVAIDAKGTTSTLTQPDYDTIIRLAEATSALPSTGDFRNQWRVNHEITGLPIERILYPRSSLSRTPAENYEDEYAETSVYGFDKTLTKLEEPTNGYEDLPRPLFELTGLVLEAREGEEGERDNLVLQRVKDVLGNVF